GPAGPQHRARLRALLRRHTRRRIVPAGPLGLPPAGGQRDRDRRMSVQLLDRELDRLEGLWSDGLSETAGSYLDAVGLFDFVTPHATEFVDLTDRIRDEVRRAGLRNGRVHMQSLHTTLGLAINENEPLLLHDFESLLDRLAPAGAGYEHDDFARRFEVPLDEPANGHAHCRQLLLSAFATLMVEEGDLVLGRWQSMFAVE